MGSHSLFIDLPDIIEDPMPNRLALNVNSGRREFIVVNTLKQITICLVYCGHLLQETSKILELWGEAMSPKDIAAKLGMDEDGEEVVLCVVEDQSNHEDSEKEC